MQQRKEVKTLPHGLMRQSPALQVCLLCAVLLPVPAPAALLHAAPTHRPCSAPPHPQMPFNGIMVEQMVQQQMQQQANITFKEKLQLERENLIIMRKKLELLKVRRAAATVACCCCLRAQYLTPCSAGGQEVQD